MKRLCIAYSEGYLYQVVEHCVKWYPVLLSGVSMLESRTGIGLCRCELMAANYGCRIKAKVQNGPTLLIPQDHGVVQIFPPKQSPQDPKLFAKLQHFGFHRQVAEPN